MNTTTNATAAAKLSKRGVLALAVLADGGKFRTALERNFRGHDKFATHLLAADGRKVAGIGSATLDELRRAGKVRLCECWKSSTWPTEYVAADAPLSEAEREVIEAHKAEWAY